MQKAEMLEQRRVSALGKEMDPPGEFQAWLGGLFFPNLQAFQIPKVAEFPQRSSR
jgi:hypothetical protein